MQSVRVPVDPSTLTFTEDELRRLSPTLGSEVVERLRGRQSEARLASARAPGGQVARPQVVSKDEVIDIQ